MTKIPKEGEDFDPTKMVNMLVAQPLLEMMALLADQRKNRTKYDKDELLPDPLPVVIDLNFDYLEGLRQAKINVINLLKEKGVAEGERNGETIQRRKTELSTQYIFAVLEPDTIREIAADMHSGSNGKNGKKEPKGRNEREIFKIWPDFKLEGHINRTVATIKADAARTSFSAGGEGIVWAVVDSGIAGDHWHFQRHRNLDFEKFDPAIRHMDFTQDWQDPNKLAGEARKNAIKEEEAAALTDDFGHGSHVAGIIAGEYISDPKNGQSAPGTTYQKDLRFKQPALVYYERRTENDEPDYFDAQKTSLSGMAPYTKLVSFKVLDERGRGEVSNIIAALAQIQIINEYGRHLRIHGVNLSVGYPFNPEWFACGQSPLCIEVDRLVKSGVVVVVSAGNSGYGTKQTLLTKKVRAGMLMTINDPGNARLAITVGATHREKPHEYGPSYFSSKGPTGDGRMKPDLLAPGERIISCASGKETKDHVDQRTRKRSYVDQSGTSMAAPHVSGAIAAFLSMRREFIGQPERVKDIFLASATDLGRDRNMQGSGLVDLMRAIQSV